ncbi:MAG: DMT family transporter [Planctomycetia bacterium]|nr:DMT family transporter [Planctomycetia bacterium]
MDDTVANVPTGSRVRPIVPYLWMLCGAFAFAVMSMLAHLVRDRFSWQAIAIGRSSVPFVLTGLSAWIAGGRLVLFGPKALWLRSLAGSTSLVCAFYALTRLPVADALTLTNLFPIWVALLSWPLLRQRPEMFVWGCAVCAVCGVILIQQPHLEDGNLATLGALIASFTSSLAMIGLHRVRGLDTRAIVWHFSGVSLLFSGSAMWLLDGRLPDKTLQVTPTSWLFLLGVGMSATIGQFCLTKAFTLGVPSRVSVVGLTQVGFALVFEVLFENRRYSAASIAGMLLVLAPTAWLLVRRREATPNESASLSDVS